jgi:ribonuclease Z
MSRGGPRIFRRVIRRSVILGVAILAVTLAYVQGYVDRDQGSPLGLVAPAVAAENQRLDITPTQMLPDAGVYFPGSEELAPDEMRLISCGTGMPTA